MRTHRQHIQITTIGCQGETTEGLWNDTVIGDIIVDDIIAG